MHQLDSLEPCKSNRTLYLKGFGLYFTIFNYGAYMTLKSTFHKALNLFSFDYIITLEYVPGTNQY